MPGNAAKGLGYKRTIAKAAKKVAKKKVGKKAMAKKAMAKKAGGRSG
jgi:hypothetical protein